jgi:hypothetical protein
MSCGLWHFYLILDTSFSTKWQSEEKSLLNPGRSNKIILGLDQLGPRRASAGARVVAEAHRGGGRTPRRRVACRARPTPAIDVGSKR